MEGQGPDGRVARLAQAGQHLQHLVLPEVDGEGEGDARLPAQRGVARLGHAVRGGGEDVVADPLHVVAGIEDDAAGRRVEADPLHVRPVEDLQALHLRRGQQGEEVDVLVPEQA